MRILVIGNLYPPHYKGGYELHSELAVGHLRANGHEVRVLTTDYRSPGVDLGEEHDGDVHRELRAYWRDGDTQTGVPLLARWRVERHDVRVLERHLQAFTPDVVNWWNLGGLPGSLVEHVRRAGVPAFGVVGDYWLAMGPSTWWRAVLRRLRIQRLVERATGVLVDLDFRDISWVFVSERARLEALAAGLDLRRTHVALAGPDDRVFHVLPEQRWRWQLLYAGRVDAEKGVDIAIEAMARLPAAASLKIVGTGEPEYARELRRLVERHRLHGRVSFLPRVTQQELAGFYGAADAVVAPARWEEPSGTVLLEAMATGTPVVATGAGGTAEYLEDERNCLLFPRDDPSALAAAVSRLAEDPDLRARLREAGLATAGRNSLASFMRVIDDALAEATSVKSLGEVACGPAGTHSWRLAGGRGGRTARRWSPAVTARERVKISASRLLSGWPLSWVSGRVAHLVGPTSLHHIYLRAQLMTASPAEAAEAVLGESVDYADEYAQVCQRLAAEATGLEGRYPDDYAVGEGTALLLYTVVRHAKPSLTLEVGVADGRSTRVILSALDANGAGRLISVDIKDDVGGAASGHPRWSLRVHSPASSLSDQLRNLLAEIGPPDLFFHDGSHTYHDQYADYLAAWEHMRPDSLFVSDDVDASFAFVDMTAAVRARPIVLVNGRKAAGVIPPRCSGSP